MDIAHCVAGSCTHHHSHPLSLTSLSSVPPPQLKEHSQEAISWSGKCEENWSCPFPPRPQLPGKASTGGHTHTHIRLTSQDFLLLATCQAGSDQLVRTSFTFKDISLGALLEHLHHRNWQTLRPGPHPSLSTQLCESRRPAALESSEFHENSQLPVRSLALKGFAHSGFG